jgi:peptidoglycan/LPS O-acetylase OafA/YrhL
MSTAATTEKRIYFPGLNGIRALAALSVVLAHMNLSENSMTHP